MKSMYVRIVVTTLCVMLGSSVIAFIISNAYYQLHLKPSNDQKITAMADEVKYHNKGAIMVTHDKRMLDVVDRIVYIEDGRMFEK